MRHGDDALSLRFRMRELKKCGRHSRKPITSRIIIKRLVLSPGSFLFLICHPHQRDAMHDVLFFRLKHLVEAQSFLRRWCQANKTTSIVKGTSEQIKVLFTAPFAPYSGLSRSFPDILWYDSSFPHRSLRPLPLSFGFVLFFPSLSFGYVHFPVPLSFGFVLFPLLFSLGFVLSPLPL